MNMCVIVRERTMCLVLDEGVQYVQTICRSSPAREHGDLLYCDPNTPRTHATLLSSSLSADPDGAETLGSAASLKDDPKNPKNLKWSKSTTLLASSSSVGH